MALVVVSAPAIDPATADAALGRTTSNATALADPAVANGAAAWAWPVAAPRVLLAPFDPPAHDYGAGHRGIDVAAAAGQAIIAPAAGVVLFAGAVGGRSVVTIDHGGGLVSSFDPALPSVSAGTEVARGSAVGRLEAGAPMHCAGGCLHVGVRRDGRYGDPLPFFGRPMRSVLLPLGD